MFIRISYEGYVEGDYESEEKAIEEFIKIIESEWKIIDGYSDYEVSNEGQVRSLKFGKIRILKHSTINSGYFQVILCNDNEVRMRTVHRLVLTAFVSPCPDGKEANHINGIKTDNRLENLEWVTRSENGLHAYRIGLSVPSRPNENPIQQFTKEGVLVTTYRSQISE